MKYKQRILVILAFAAICCTLIFLAPAVTEIQFGEAFAPTQSHRKFLGNVHFRKGQAGGKLPGSRGSFGAHLNFMRKDLSNYTGDNNNSSELSDLFGSKHRDLGKLSDKKAQNVIKELGGDANGDDLFNTPRDSQENQLLSNLKEIFLNDDTFLQKGNLENLVYLANLIKRSPKTSAHRVLTKKEILEELTNKLQSEGVIIRTAGEPTKLPVVTENVIVTGDEWSALNKVRPSMFSGQKKQRRGRGPLLNIYPRPRK